MQSHTYTRGTPTDDAVDARAMRLLAALTDDDRARLVHLRSGVWSRPDVGWDADNVVCALLVNGADPGSAHRARSRERNAERQRLRAFEAIEDVPQRLAARREQVRQLHIRAWSTDLIAGALDVSDETVACDLKALGFVTGQDKGYRARRRQESESDREQRRHHVTDLHAQGLGSLRIAQQLAALLGVVVTPSMIQNDLQVLGLIPKRRRGKTKPTATPTAMAPTC